MKYTKNNHKASPLYVKRALKWADELDINPKKCKGEMRDRSGGRCCLGVAEDYAKENSKLVKGNDDFNPSPSCQAYFGWKERLPIIGRVSAWESNDGNGAKELTHKQIATKIRKEYAPENLVEK